MNVSSPFKCLFEPIRIGPVQLRNRLVMLPMETNYATEDGFVTDRAKAYYRARAKDVGLVLIQITCVESEKGKGYRCQMCIDDDSRVQGLSELVDTIHSQGAKTFVQLQHAGANARGPEIFAASPVPLAPGKTVPKALTIASIEDIVARYGQAAIRAQKAGFDGVEIVASGGYLVWNFLTPTTNKRTDEYGGSLENRARLFLNIIREVRARVGKDYPITCRLACKEYDNDGGFSVADALRVLRWGVEAGLNGITITAIGGDSIAPQYSAVLLPLAIAVKQVVDVPVTAAARMDLETGAAAVARGEADLVGIGRRLLADPDYIRKAASGAAEDIRPCIACKTCIDYSLFQNVPLRCAVNPLCGNELTTVELASKKKKVVVVGGGPGGMEAAIVAAQRGHDVTLYEENEVLGGQMIQAALPPGKSPLAPLTKHLAAQVEKSGVKVVLGHRVDVETIEKAKPDVAIVAAGRNDFVPRIPGTDKAHTVMASDVLMDKVPVGFDVVVIGGELVGCETAEFLADKGRQVAIVEILPQLMTKTSPIIKMRMLRRLADKKVKTFVAVAGEEYSQNTMIISAKDGGECVVPCDTIVFATGGIPNSALAKELNGRVPEVHAIGDCVAIADIITAMDAAFKVSCSI